MTSDRKGAPTPKGHGMSLREIEFESFNKRDTVHAWRYAPVTEPVAVVQLIHGLGEHSRRYLHLISSLVANGIVVVANDHVGHGKTGMESGIWQDTGDTGWETYVEDEYSLTQIAKEEYPDLPYFIFGHSWGSMIGRAYMTRHGEELDGLMLCGVVEQWLGADQIDRQALQAEIDAGRGAEPAPDALLGQLFAGATDRFGDDPHPNDWIAAFRPIVDDHAVDPFNNFNAHMTTRFLKDFVDINDVATAPDIAEHFPLDLPVLLLAGDQDPVGNYGEGVYHAANKLWKRGLRDVRTVVYSGLRHEVHNEPESRDEVEAEILVFVFLNSQVAADDDLVE